jgi:hypothetical protein
MRVLAILLLALPAFGTMVFKGTNEFVNGVSLTPTQFMTGVDPAPFNIATGDLAANASFSFTFDSYGTPSGITTATVVLGLYDLDSAASGNQIGSFTFGGVDLTSALNAVSETANAANGTITYLTLTLPSSTFAAIQSGNVPVALSFQGPGLGVLGETTFNGGGIDFAEIIYNTGPITPEPSSFLLAAGGGLAILLRKRWRLRRS